MTSRLLEAAALTTIAGLLTLILAAALIRLFGSLRAREQALARTAGVEDCKGEQEGH
jgi:hypothetical protein